MANLDHLLNEKLRSLRFFAECILWDFHSTRFTYGLDLSINYVWDEVGCVREGTLEKPLLYVFQLLGLESIHLTADLTLAMKSDPGMINWGFAEVARVEAFESAAGCGLSIRWEGARRLSLEFNDYIFLSPEGHPL